jgi:hypothetical protein
MNILSRAELAKKIKTQAAKANSVLFAGAGIGVRVGLPSWYDFIEHLAEVCDEVGDPESALSIRARAKSGSLTRAATVYKTSDRLPPAELFTRMAAPFRKQIEDVVLNRIHPLVGLRFTGIVTTNYDRSLHDAFAQVYGRVPRLIEKDDSLRAAAFLSESFIARIHGRAEHPESMVVDTGDYAALAHNDLYADFLLDVLKRRPCLFVGFSFLDPAINQVLSTFERLLSPQYPTLHVAVLPTSSDPSLAEALARVNIQPLFYDDEHEHRALWRAVRDAYSHNALVAERPPQPAPPVLNAGMHRFMAFAYAQAQTRKIQGPLLGIVIQGIIVELLSVEPRSDHPTQEIVSRVAREVHLGESESEQIIAEAIERLKGGGVITGSSNSLRLEKAPENNLDGHLERLANSVGARARVREGVRVTDGDLRAVKSILEQLFVVRSWDLAAHFAGTATGWASDLLRVIKDLVRASGRQRALSAPSSIERAIFDLIENPDGEESALLVDIGRTAFAVQLVLASPRQALLQQHALPERIYLDASILLPAITNGHPLRPAYQDALQRLDTARRRFGSSLEIAVGQQFLNEVISHRKIAIDMVNALELEDQATLRKHITFYGAENTNVFVGAYASHVGRESKPIRFMEFLRDTAPYETEDELAVYLKGMGIVPVAMEYYFGNNRHYAEIFSALKQGYEEIGRGDKDTVLVEHESQQLVRLHLDLGEGQRGVFATQDFQMVRAVQRTPKIRYLSHLLFSHVGLLSMIDVMIGLEADERSLARIMWGVARTDSEQAIREYLIDRALQVFHDAKAASVAQELAEKLAPAAAREAGNGLLLRPRSFEDAARTASFMDRYEDQFFKMMQEAMDRGY